MDLFSKAKDSVTNAVSALTRSQAVKDWLTELAEAEKRERTWRKKAQECVEIYEQASNDSGNQANLSDYNILYANTETLSPAVFNNTPRPLVKRRAKKDDPVAIAAAQVLKGTLIYLSNTGDREKASFDDLQISAVQEALVAGRGLTRFDYDAEVDGDGDEGSIPSVNYECVEGEQIPWNRVLYGYAKNWHQVPWVAFEHFMTKDECKKNFGNLNIKLTHASSVSDDKDKANSRPANAEGVKFAHIYEIWDRRTKKVFFVSEGYDNVFKQSDDPYKLSGFFPCPRPMIFLPRVSSLCPQTLYQMYERQALELEKCTRRIDNMLDMLKVRGFYDGTLTGLDELLNKANGTLVPAPNVAAMQQGQTLDKAIWLFPLEKCIAVLQQLYLARQQIIGVIYQITGIADIMRGDSQASETLGAQEIKQSWGTMRLKRMQREVARYTRDCFRLQAELAAGHFSIETFQTMTGLKFPMNAEKQQAQMQFQQFQQQAQMSLAQVPPEQQQQARQASQQGLQQAEQQLQQLMSTPSWEDVLQFLRTDKICNYIIDIETNSTVDIEATEDKQELAEMMNAMSQLLNGVLPMVQEGVLPFKAAQALCLAVIGKFRLGDEVEETFRSMQEPPPKQDPKTQQVEAQMQLEKSKNDAQMQRDQQKHELDMKAKEAELNQKAELARMQMELDKMELQFKQREMQMRMAEADAKHRQNMETIMLKATMPPAAPTPAPGQDGGSGA